MTTDSSSVDLAKALATKNWRMLPLQTEKQLRSKWRSWFVIAPIALVLATLAYFVMAAQTPDAGEVEGTWVHVEPDNTLTTLTLNHDGTFAVTQAPPEVFVGPGSPYWGTSIDWNNLTSVEGDWRVSSFQTGGSPRIDFNIGGRGNPQGYGTHLTSSGLGPWRSLTINYGPADDENQFTFTRP